MVFLAKDHKGGRTYLYLRENHRVNGKPVRKWQIKLGAEEDIKVNGEVASDRKVCTKSIEGFETCGQKGARGPPP